MANPFTSQGTLNRALVSIALPEHPQLSVTSGFFGTKVARITFEGAATDYIGTLTGAVSSPRLYQMASISFYLNKSQIIATAWEAQRLLDTRLGVVMVTTDSSTLPVYPILNCVLVNVSDLDFSGESNDYHVEIKGYYPINNTLFL